MSVTVGGVTYDVTPDALTTAASNCTTTADNVSTQLATLASYVESIPGFWQGPAATQFQALMDEFQAAANGINLALTQISAGLSGTSMNYTAAEDAAVAATQAINITAANLT
jgi:WXG100 family type VII secretion target